MSPSPSSGWRQYPQSWGPSEGGHDVLHQPHGCLLSNSYPPRFLTIPSSNLKWEDLPVHHFWDSWLVITKLIPCLWKLHELLLQLCKDLEIVISVEKSDRPNKVQYLGMLIDTIQERVYMKDSSIRLPDSRMWQKFLHPSSLPAKMWSRF